MRATLLPSPAMLSPRPRMNVSIYFSLSSIFAHFTGAAGPVREGAAPGVFQAARPGASGAAWSRTVGPALPSATAGVGSFLHQPEKIDWHRFAERLRSSQE